MEDHREYEIEVKFQTDTRNVWYYGTRTGGTFSRQPASREHPGPGHYLRWGCLSLNFWFTAKSGRTFRQASANAVQRLRHFYPAAEVTVTEAVRPSIQGGVW